MGENETCNHEVDCYYCYYCYYCDDPICDKCSGECQDTINEKGKSFVAVCEECEWEHGD